MKLALIGCSFIALAAGPAYAADSAGVAPGAAQDTAAQDASDAAETAGGLGDIIVTAQRKTENLQRAALAVDVLTGEDLVKSGITSAADLDQLSPSIDVANGGGANVSFFIRGVGNFGTNAYTDPATAFNYDGVYIGRPSATAGLLYDLERVEVLKGPQGTLYGRNATAGAINVIPAKPRIGELSGNFVASYGNYDAVNIQGAVNAPIGDRGALRVAGTLSKRDGYMSDGTSSEDVQAIRFQMLSELTDTLTVRVQGDYAHAGGKPEGSFYYATLGAFDAATQSYSFNPTGFSRGQGLLDPASQAFRQTVYNGQARRNLNALPDTWGQDADFFGANAEIALETGIGTLTFIPAYRTSTIDVIHSSPGFTPYTQEDFEQSSFEARLNGKSGGMEYIFGLYLYNEDIDGNYTFNQASLSSYQDFKTSTRSYAAFGRLTYSVTDRFRLVGGLRFTKDKKKIDAVADTILQICTLAACPNAPLIPVSDRPEDLPFAVPARGGTPLPVLVNGVATGANTIRTSVFVNDRTSADRVTYRLAAEYDVGDRSLLYASYETGFRSGGFSLAAGRESFEPEYLKAFTLGSKNRFFDNRVQVNLEAFYWKYTNQQVPHFGRDLNGNSAFFTENVGKSTIKGIEADTQIAATDNLLLQGTVQYLDATFDDFTYDIPNNAAPVIGCAFSQKSATLTTVDCSGKPAYQSPKWVVRLGAQQTIPLGDHKLVLAADTQYKSNRYIAFEYLPVQLAPSFWQSNASVTFANGDDRWSVSGFVRNIENYRDLTSGTFWGTGRYQSIRPGAPRTYGVRVSASF